MNPPSPRWTTRATDLGFAIALLAVTLAVYQPAWRGGVLWDDDRYIPAPSIRSLDGLRQIWTELSPVRQVYPLTYSVFWLQYQFWGDDTLGYHLANITLHALSAFVVMLILRRLGIPGAHLAALIFALHPVQVESVAWITELKNALSGLFYLSAALLYLRFDERRRWRDYAIALTLFALALLSKTVTASLPAALLVVFWWQRGRLQWRRDVAPLLPFFALGAGMGLLSAWVERTLGAEGSEFSFNLLERCLIAGRVIWFYLAKLCWPVDLTFIYPRWQIDAGQWWQYLFPLGALALTAALWLLRKQSRGPLAALLFFIGTLFPVLGFFNVYPFRFSFVADHFQYLASLGIITLFAAGVTRLLPKGRLAAVAAASLIALVLGAMSWGQAHQYVDVETLYRETLKRNPGMWLVHNNLAVILDAKGNIDDVVEHYREATRLKPDYFEAYLNWGNMLAQHGRLDEAIELYQKAVSLRPGLPDAYLNLGNAMRQQGRYGEAVAAFKQALNISPNLIEGYLGWGTTMVQQKRYDEGVALYKEALRLKPDCAEAYLNWSGAMGEQGRYDEAIELCRKALSFKPDMAEAHNNWGLTLAIQGRLPEAAVHFREAVRLKPDFTAAAANLRRAEAMIH